MPDVPETKAFGEYESNYSSQSRIEPTIPSPTSHYILLILDEHNGFSVDSVHRKYLQTTTTGVKIWCTATNGATSWFEWLKVEVLVDPIISDVMQRADRTIRNGAWVDWSKIGRRRSHFSRFGGDSHHLSRCMVSLWTEHQWTWLAIVRHHSPDCPNSVTMNGSTADFIWSIRGKRGQLTVRRIRFYQSSHIGRLCWVLVKQHQLVYGEWSCLIMMRLSDC